MSNEDAIVKFDRKRITYNKRDSKHQIRMIQPCVLKIRGKP